MSLLVLRLGCVAVLVFYHGWAGGKAAWDYLWNERSWPLIDRLAEMGYPYPPACAVAAAIACSLASITLVLGFLTRLSALLVIVVLVAALPFSFASDLPIHRELHSLYILGFSLILLLGGGRHALDIMFMKKRAF